MDLVPLMQMASPSSFPSMQMPASGLHEEARSARVREVSPASVHSGRDGRRKVQIPPPPLLPPAAAEAAVDAYQRALARPRVRGCQQALGRHPHSKPIRHRHSPPPRHPNPPHHHRAGNVLSLLGEFCLKTRRSRCRRRRQDKAEGLAWRGVHAVCRRFHQTTTRR